MKDLQRFNPKAKIGNWDLKQRKGVLVDSPDNVILTDPQNSQYSIEEDNPVDPGGIAVVFDTGQTQLGMQTYCRLFA